MTFDKDQVLQAIDQGATIADLAATHNIGWAETASKLDELGIPHPNALNKTAPDQFVAQMMGLVEDGFIRTSHEDLIVQPDGTLFGMPKGFSIQRIDLKGIFERFHGPNGYVDPYTGQPTNGNILTIQPLNLKSDRPPNLLITNIQTISDSSINTRFCKWMRPITETFEYAVNDWIFKLVITAPYDKLVGGTYQKLFVDHLFERWVGQPLAKYETPNIEKEPVFYPKTPFEMAWWSWQQLTHYGLLKGLAKLEVSAPDNRSAVLSDDDVMNAVLGYSLKDGAPSLVTAGQMPTGNPKFSPGGLIR